MCATIVENIYQYIITIIKCCAQLLKQAPHHCPVKVIESQLVTILVV
jgi:hypothetical protein